MSFRLLAFLSLVLLATEASTVCNSDGECESDLSDPSVPDLGLTAENLAEKRNETYQFDEEEEKEFAAWDEDEDEYDYDDDYDEEDMEFDRLDAIVDDLWDGLASMVGVPQTGDNVPADFFEESMRESVTHVMHVASNPDLMHMVEQCKNKDPNCIELAYEKGCDGDHRAYMDENCCALCFSAAQLDFLDRCRKKEDAVDIWGPGDQDKMFHRITTDETLVKMYSPKVHSRPAYLPGDDETNADYKIGPWIVTLQNFVSQAEAKRLIHWGNEFVYERSLDGGETNLDGTSGIVETEDRTSMDTRCDGDCLSDPIVQNIHERIEQVTGFPQSHIDFLQLLKYLPGQFYRPHYDWHSYQVDCEAGARVLTFYMYLNDVTDDGGTNFPELDITVQPKLGQVLLWSNVQGDDPDRQEPRVLHQALPLGSGVKYGATAWMHPRNFKEPSEYGCAE